MKFTVNTDAAISAEDENLRIAQKVALAHYLRMMADALMMNVQGEAEFPAEVTITLLNGQPRHGWWWDDKAKLCLGYTEPFYGASVVYDAKDGILTITDSDAGIIYENRIEEV